MTVQAHLVFPDVELPVPGLGVLVEEVVDHGEYLLHDGVLAQVITTLQQGRDAFILNDYNQLDMCSKC